MGNITSSHDQLRFMSYADGQISFDEDGIARAFDNPVKKTRNFPLTVSSVSRIQFVSTNSYHILW